MIYLIKTFVSCVISIWLFSGCTTWDWKAKPYAPDYEYESILYIDDNNQEHEVKCSDPEFNNYVCFPMDNIVELKYAIEKIKKKCKLR